MTKRALILTHPTDIHAYAVALALQRKGCEAVIWQTSDFPTQAHETVHFGDAGQTMAIESVSP